MRSWENYGDVNYLEHDGSLVRHAYSEDDVRKYPALANEYEVLMLTPDPDREGMVFAGIKRMCPEDWGDNYEVIESVMGEMPENEAGKAVYIAEYIGLEPGLDAAPAQAQYPTADMYHVSREEAKVWLLENNVPEEWLGTN